MSYIWKALVTLFKIGITCMGIIFILGLAIGLLIGG